MKRATRALYEPWLDASTRHFQDLVRKAGKPASLPVVGERDVCVLFVDGLRFDVGAVLAGELEQRGLIVKLGFRLSPANSHGHSEARSHEDFRRIARRQLW